MQIRGIVLAAGKADRMGVNKLAQQVNGISLLEHVLHHAGVSKLSEVIVVYGRYDCETDFEKRYNPAYESGMGGSIRKGLEGFNGDGVMILLGDMPYVSSETIDQLIDAFEANSHGKDIVVPVYEGRRGNPVILGKRYFHELMALDGDKGARELILREQQQVLKLNMEDPSVLLDIDDVESLKLWSSELRKLLVYRSDKKSCSSKGDQNVSEMDNREHNQDMDSNCDTGITPRCQVISFVGAGGKTTSMYKLAEMLRRMNKRVLVTTTTKIYEPSPSTCQYNELITGELSAVQSRLVLAAVPGAVSIWGRFINSEHKLVGSLPDEIDVITQSGIFDYILVEADGAKGKAIKAPASYEPVLPASTTTLVGVIGLSVIGKKLQEENVHRSSLFCAITDSAPMDDIGEKQILALIKNPHGIFKHAPEAARRVVLLNQFQRKRQEGIVETIKATLRASEPSIELLVGDWEA